jgi:nucleoside-diphosphate-sugar epimerase
MTPRHILVTGASGFVGRAVVRALQGDHDTVWATYCHNADDLPESPGLQWIQWDATTGTLPDVDWSLIDGIIHLAVPERPFTFPQRARALYDLNVHASARLLEQACTCGVRRVVLASTGDVLEDHGHAAREHHIDYRPNDFYATTKACAELLFRGYASRLSTAVVRFFHPYGPGGDRFLINRVVEAVCSGRPIRIEGRAGILLNPVWSPDLAEGVVAALRHDATGIFHLGGAELLTLRSLVDRIERLSGYQAVIEAVPAERGPQHAGDITRARRVLNFNPRVDLEEGLRRVLDDVPAAIPERV